MPSVKPIVEPEVIDPVCGMSILPLDAVGEVVHGGQSYHFCSQSCIDKFRASPDAYLTAQAPPSIAAHPRPDSCETFRSVSVIGNALRLRRQAL
jgi:YHS domain-containing protein